MKTDIDFKKFNRTTGTVIPYCEIKRNGKKYYVYEGGFGNNRFRYWELSSNSTGGRLCKKYLELSKSVNDREDALDILTQIFSFPPNIEGHQAYLAYWKGCFTDKDKLEMGFETIQHRDALWDWYKVNLGKYLKDNEKKFLSQDEKDADIVKWKSKKASDVYKYLTICHNEITLSQAVELDKFLRCLRGLTFDDWINNRFVDEKDLLGRFVANDSERYVDLAVEGKMTYEELNKIQSAQKVVYEYMIKSTVDSSCNFFLRRNAISPDPILAIESEIEKKDIYINEKKVLSHEVLLPRLHRGMKIGAKYISAGQYYSYCKGFSVDAFLCVSDGYQLTSDGKLASFPNDDQMEYARMEANIVYRNKLREILSSHKSIMKKRTPEARLRPSAPTIAQFCRIIRDIPILPQGHENNDDFCIRVCQHFSLTYTDNVRKAFGERDSLKHMEKVKTTIVPNLKDDDAIKKILTFLNNNQSFHV